MQGFTKTLAIELGPFGITANAVAPGLHRHRHDRGHRGPGGHGLRGLPEGRRRRRSRCAGSGQPDDVAHTISFLASEGAGFVSGQVIYVAGGPLC